VRVEHFEHVIAAAAEVTGQDELVVIGSQAILGSINQPPDALLQSLEADIYPLRDPASADAIDGALGDGSQFHLAYGYYAHGVGPETARAPKGWQQRLIRREIPTRVASSRRPVALCLEIHDLILSKCVAGRERDWDYAAEAIRAGLADPATLFARVPGLPVADDVRAQVEKMLRALTA
jgi:Nucleotidyltransferase of unknown function (DUF6036)